jgi:hypothetical protein
MDERRTLVILGWSVGGVVGLMFLLSAIALASVQSPSGQTSGQLLSSNAPPVHAAVAPARASGT